MEENKLFSKVFLWLAVGLLLSFGVGYYVSTQANMINNLYKGGSLILLWIVQLVVVVVLSMKIHKMNALTAKILFLLYSILTGLTLSSIFIVYKLESIIIVFGETALLFGSFAAIGMFTKIDLTKFGTYLFMALVGIVLASLVNVFLHNSMMDLIINCFAIIIFLGYTAYDIQRIKQISYGLEEDNAAIFGAFELYIDFINLFLRLLEFFGKKND